MPPHPCIGCESLRYHLKQTQIERAAVQKERDHWKANHDKQVSNKQVTAAKRDEFKAERDRLEQEVVGLCEKYGNVAAERDHWEGIALLLSDSAVEADERATAAEVLVRRLFDYVMIQEGGFRAAYVLLANEAAAYLNPE